MKLRVDPNLMLKYDDPREMPAYGIREAAHYLQLPQATLKSWVAGRPYPTKSGPRTFEPLIRLPEPGVQLLSFFNLAEVHVLSAFRRDHRIEMHRIRTALKYVRRELNCARPLIDQHFETDGVALFIRKLGNVVDASAGGQIVMRTVKAHLRRLERVGHVVARLYPFTRADIEDSPKSVVIDPRFSFGRPCLAGIHIATAVIAARYKAGESIDELAEDYGCQRFDIEEGLRCELGLSAAA